MNASCSHNARLVGKRGVSAPRGWVRTREDPRWTAQSGVHGPALLRLWWMV